MPNFTNKAKLKKPLASEYFNIDDMNGNMDLIEQEFYTPKYSEELFNVDVDRFKVGTGIVEDIFKDYSNKMEQSLVTINNIQGKTEKRNNHLISRWIPSIASIPMDNPTNHFSKAAQTDSRDVIVNRVGNDVKITAINNTIGWASVEYTVVLELGKVYNISAQDVIIGPKGKSGIEVYGGAKFVSQQPNIQLFNSKDSHVSVTNNSFVVTSPNVKLRLHCTLDSFDGEVTYKNISIYEVSDFNVTDIGLRSLQNGVNDVLKDGIVEKRVSDVIYFKDLIWHSSVTNGHDPNSSHYVYYAFPPNMKSPQNLQDEDLLITCNCLDTKPQNYTNSSAGDSQFHINCISAHTERSEVRVKLNRSIAPDLDTFNSWCNEGAYFQYELKEPTTIYVNTSLKCIEGDSVFISSPQSVTCTHKVQLNTKAQVEELQDVILKEKKSIWHKLKELVNVKIYFGDLSYIKFPTVLGGLLIQWGSYDYTGDLARSNQAWRSYPLAFSTDYHIVVGKINSQDEYTNPRIVAGYVEKGNVDKLKFRYNGLSLPNQETIAKTTVTWIAIGI